MLLDLVTPLGSVLKEEADELLVPACDGLMGILKGHDDMIAALGEGTLVVKNQAGEKSLSIEGGGFLQVDGDNVYVLAEKASPIN